MGKSDTSRSTRIPPEGQRPELRHFTASLPMLLLRAREAVMLRFRSMLREQGLTEQQWRVLRALGASDGSEVSGLASSTFLLGPSLSRILSELDAQGLISTRVHATDQRRKIVRLTPAGAARLGEIAPLSEAIYEEIVTRIGSEQLQQLQSLLATTEAALRGDGER